MIVKCAEGLVPLTSKESNFPPGA